MTKQVNICHYVQIVMKVFLIFFFAAPSSLLIIHLPSSFTGNGSYHKTQFLIELME